MNGLAELVISTTGSSARIRHIPYDEAYEHGFEDMQRRFPDISKIRALTGWEPTRSIVQIVDDVVRYERHRASTAAPRTQPA